MRIQLDSHHFILLCFRMVGKNQEEKSFVNYDELDEAEDGAQGRSRTMVDALCRKCYLLPCAKCSCRYTIALLSSLGFAASRCRVTAPGAGGREGVHIRKGPQRRPEAEAPDVR